MITTSSSVSEDSGASDTTGTHDPQAAIWVAFATAGNSSAFCKSWLELQCSQITGVRAGLLLLREPGGESFVPAAVWPEGISDVGRLGKAAEQTLASRRGVVLPADGPQGRIVHAGMPVEIGSELVGAAVLELAPRPEPLLKVVLRQMLWGAGWLEAWIRREQSGRTERLLQRSATGMDILQAVQEQDSLEEAAMTAANELQSRLGADRVGIGLDNGNRLRLVALSRTAWFDARSQLVESIEEAMEEAIDQEGVVAYPAAANRNRRVNAAQRDLASRAGSKAVLSVPLMAGGRPAGALTLERSEGPPFDAATLELCELMGVLLGPALEARQLQARWFGGRLHDVLQDWRDRFLGPRHPAAKLGLVLALLLAGFCIFATGEFRITARTTVEGAVQRAIVAPFEGYVAQALVRAGDTVREGQLLAVLDDRDLQLDRVRWDSEREQAERKYRDALARRDRASSQILAAQLSQAQAQLALTEQKILRTRLVAPFDAVVVSGDLSQLLGAPLETGKVLFELTPLDAYRVVLKVDERDISYVTRGMTGELALTGLMRTNLPFTVSTVTSVSTPQDGHNYFRAEARMPDNALAELRPGMEGVGKISVGEERLIWIWTRNFVNWLRLAVWTWMP